MSRHESEGLGVGEYTYSQYATAELITSLRSGDLSVVPQLVEAYIPLVRNLAVKYARYNRSMREELYTVGLESVFLLLPAASTNLKDDNLTYYLIGCLRKIMLRASWKLRNPIGSWDTANRKGRKNSSFTQRRLDPETHLAKDEGDLLALRNLIFSLTKNAVERDVISRLADGETGAEIADSLNVNEMSITRIRATIYRRFLRYERDLEDAEIRATKISEPTPVAEPANLQKVPGKNETAEQKPASITSRTLHGDGTPASSHDAYFSEFCH